MLDRPYRYPKQLRSWRDQKKIVGGRRGGGAGGWGWEWGWGTCGLKGLYEDGVER